MCHEITSDCRKSDPGPPYESSSPSPLAHSQSPASMSLKIGISGVHELSPMPHRNMKKEDKLYSITYHFYQSNPNGEDSTHSEDETGSDDTCNSFSNTHFFL